MKTVTKVMIVLGILILVGLVGCGKSGGSKEIGGSEGKSIVGKWRQIEAEREPQIIEFLKDERVLIYDLKDINKKEEVGLSGDYRFIDKKTIRMNVALFGPITAEISPSEDEITLTNPFGKIETYRRVGEFGREEEKPVRPSVPIPKRESSASKVAFSRGVFQVGDFSVALSSVQREQNRANLNFAITKVGKTGIEIEPLAIILTDDHQNNYSDVLDLLPYDDFPFHLLPSGFTYVKTASVTMPNVAPIETIQLEDIEKISFKKLKLVKPPFKTDFGNFLSQPGKATPVGKFLFFSIDGIVPDLYTWAIAVTIENKEYNPLRGGILSAVQFTDGKIASSDGKVAKIDGSSKETVLLQLKPLQDRKASQFNMILLLFQNLSSGETTLKLLPVSDKNLPPLVGQETDEKIFIEVYQRNGGHKALGDPLGLPHWFAGGDKSKDEFDVLVQEFPTSVIVWDKQKYASSAYVLHGAVLKKYQEPEIYRNLGPPTSDLKSEQSNFGTKGIYCTFENGAIISRADQTFIVMGKVYKKWKEENFVKGALGFPVSDEKVVTSGAQGFDTTGWIQRFEGGYICCVTKGENAGQDFAIHGAIAKVYSETGAEKGWLGFPVNEIYQSLGLKPADQVEFEGGYIGSRDGTKWEAFPYEAGQIVFTSNRDGDKEIYVMDANGRNQVNLTNNPADDDSPAWSPNGRKIAFVSKRNGSPSIYIMDADGSNLRRLTHEFSGDPSWSPDGSELIFCSTYKKEQKDYWGKDYKQTLAGIFVINQDGTNQRLIWSAGLGIEPAFSPDGRKIAFVTVDSFYKTSKSWIMTSDGGNPRLIDVGLYSPRGLRWSPSGNKIVFYLTQWSQRQEGEAIGLVSPDGGNVTWLTNRFGKDPSFSPDGERIVFSHKGEIYIMDITGSLGRKITKDTKGENWSPSWTAGKQEGKTKAIPTEETISIKETIPVEKTIPAEKVIPDIKISEADIPGKYILEELDSQGNPLGKEPGIMTFQEDGSMIGSYSGRWLVQNEEINFFEGSKKIGKGKLLAGAIANWQVEDIPCWQAEKIMKKEGAEMLRKVSEWIIVWSEYFSPENKSFALKLQKDTSFSMSGFLEEKWKIENGAVQIYKGEKKTDFSDGRIEGKNIVFKLKDGLVRLTRQN